ncbi:glycosyltransferase [Acinetobacter baumannii]|uniref:glycosyltransferase n=1 Tax=Acinetobacter baumannii TaxID=470 RepID=UPI0038B4A0A5
MKIDMIMMSKFGYSDGGRETWFNNFFNEMNEDKDDLEVVLYSLKLRSENMVDFHMNGSNLIENHQIDLGTKSFLPLTLLFILKLCLLITRKNNRSSQVVAVGSLNEMLACFFSYPPILYRGKKIIWLRTISRREFGMKTKILRLPLIFVEYILLKFYFDRVLTNGKDTGDFYSNIGVANKVINNGVNAERWFNEISTIPKEDKISIAFIGRLEKNKGIVEFCNAIRLFNKRGSNNISFKIVGQGSCVNNVLELVNEEKNVEFINGLNNQEMPSFLRNINVSVALTFSTASMGGGGLSNALLEQMCSGNLIVAWDNPIFRQILNEDCSILVEQGNELKLVDTFAKISNEYNSMRELRLRSQALSLKNSSKNNKNQFLSILTES